MKKLLILLVFLVGCATSNERATAYCDSNWQGRYDTWQSCYDRQLPQQHNRAMHALSVGLGSAGQGLQNPTCTTWNNVTTCH